MFDLVFLLSDFVMSIEDSIYEFRSKQRNLYVMIVWFVRVVKVVGK